MKGIGEEDMGLWFERVYWEHGVLLGTSWGKQFEESLRTPWEQDGNKKLSKAGLLAGWPVNNK
jgi:hypothetical protein